MGPRGQLCLAKVVKTSPAAPRAVSFRRPLKVGILGRELSDDDYIKVTAVARQVQRWVLEALIDKHANRLLRTKSSILNFQRFPEMPVTSEVSPSMELEV